MGLLLAFVSEDRSMRTFSLHRLSTSAVVLALAACNNPAPHLIDAYMPPGDSGPPVDMNFMTPDSPRPDTGGIDSGSGGSCRSYGGGCQLTIGAGATDSCPMMGTTRQGCYPGMTMTQCATAGAAQAGQACMNLNDCDDGLICLMTNVCARMCCSAGDCMPGEMCNPLGGVPMGSTLGVCNRPTMCTPVPNGGCPAMQQCLVVAMDGTTDCAPEGTATEGMACGGTTGMGCVAGLGCYGPAMMPGMCSRLCRLAMMNADCTGTAHTCTNVGLGMTYGLCQ
jgi:hypothetical protein